MLPLIRLNNVLIKFIRCMGQGMKNGPSKIYGRQPLKNFK